MKRKKEREGKRKREGKEEERKQEGLEVHLNGMQHNSKHDHMIHGPRLPYINRNNTNHQQGNCSRQENSIAVAPNAQGHNNTSNPPNIRPVELD